MLEEELDTAEKNLRETTEKCVASRRDERGKALRCVYADTLLSPALR